MLEATLTYTGQRATPDMRLVRVFKEPGGDGLSRAEQILEELAKLAG